MHRSQGIALARRAIVSNAQLRPTRFLPIAIRPVPAPSAKVTAPHQCTAIRCNSSSANAESNVEETPEFIWPGDWICASCRSHNYRSRTTCILCQESVSLGRTFYIPGMWHCPKCNQAVRKAEGDTCAQCSTKREPQYEYPRNERDMPLTRETRPPRLLYRGQWRCTDCDFRNSPKATQCFKCGSKRMMRDAEKFMGDWECPDCEQINYAHRDVCHACSTEKPSKSS